MQNSNKTRYRESLIAEKQLLLKQYIQSKVLRRKIILVTPVETGWNLQFEGIELDNTIVRCVKPMNKYFTMKLDLTGDENEKELKAYANFYVKYLKKSIESDMQEIEDICEALKKNRPDISDESIFERALMVFNGLGVRDEFSKEDTNCGEILIPLNVGNQDN